MYTVLGLFYILNALWWTIHITKRHLLCKEKRMRYFSTMTFTSSTTCCQKFPMEGLLKIIWSFTGIVYTILLPVANNSVDVTSCFNLTTICLVICISGITDVLAHKTKWLPPGMDYCLNSASYIIQCLLFSSNVLTADHITEQKLYFLFLSLTALCSGLSILLEHKFHRSLLVALSRLFFISLLGTWLVQCDISLPDSFSSNLSLPERHVSVTLQFTWHCIGVILLLSLTCTTWSCLYRKCCSLQKGDIDFELLKAPKCVRNREAAVIRLTNLWVSSDSTDDEKTSDDV